MDKNAVWKTKPSPIARKLNLPGRKTPARKATPVRTTAARKQTVEMIRRSRSTRTKDIVRGGSPLRNLCSIALLSEASSVGNACVARLTETRLQERAAIDVCPGPASVRADGF